MESQRKTGRVDASESGGIAGLQRADRVRLAPWIGSMVLHGTLGIALGAWGSVQVKPAEAVTSGSWAGTVFEVGLSSTNGGEGAPVVPAVTETASAPPGPTSVSDGKAELELGREQADTADQSSKAEQQTAEVTSSSSVWERQRPLPSGDAQSPKAQRPTSEDQAEALGDKQDGTRGEQSAASDAGRGSGEGGEALGLGGEQAVARLGQLPAAWTRALPAAARGDATWHELEPGLVGRWLVLAKLDEQGVLTSLEVESGSRPFIDRLLRVSQAFLRAGRFALPAGSSGEHRLGLEVSIDQVGEASPDGAPHLVRQLASRYPTAEEPGEAIVVFNSGRRVLLRVFLDPGW